LNSVENFSNSLKKSAKNNSFGDFFKIKNSAPLQEAEFENLFAVFPEIIFSP
jgi:hypothetical protein